METGTDLSGNFFDMIVSRVFKDLEGTPLAEPPPPRLPLLTLVWLRRATFVYVAKAGKLVQPNTDKTQIMFGYI